jgi:AcrR family transcriptional regulator
VTTDAATPPRERAAHLGPERRRPQILDAALQIAADSGTAAVTIGAVAKHLGVTRPVVYSCFSDRVELLAALLDREGESLRETLLEALHTGRGDDPEAAFIDGYRALLRAVESQPDTWRFVYLAHADPAVAGMVGTTRRELAASAARWIAPALTAWWQTTELNRKMPILIELFVSSSEAAVRSLLNPENDWDADGLGEFYGRIMCRAFAAA